MNRLLLAVAFAVAAFATSSHARCSARGNCADEIAACAVTAGCASMPTLREQRRCVRLCKRGVLHDCRQGTINCGSPSGAFLD